uniref:Uncharacterized protein LOC114324920 isoform X1 n=1 Tax=Diabrotica virgifera virgifera TaxID=50390 RepID=A0A6P7F5B7_DIAVI
MVHLLTVSLFAILCINIVLGYTYNGVEYTVDRELATESYQQRQARPFGQRDCNMPAEEQNSILVCLPRRRVWTWSIVNNECVTERTIGCSSTKNNFATEAQCLEVAKPICGH